MNKGSSWKKLKNEGKNFVTLHLYKSFQGTEQMSLGDVVTHLQWSAYFSPYRNQAGGLDG